ncbi:MAG: PAS domain-containing protein, partial [Pseudobdellovibrionaceae bacterium]
MAANLERFFQLSKDLLVIGTPDGLPIMMSPSWTTLLGWSEEELKTIKAQELIHPDDLERTADKVEKSLRGEDIFSFTNRYRHKNGTYVSLIWTGTFSKEDGLIYAIAKDISDFAKVEERLKQSERRLKAAQKIAKIGSWDLALDLEEVDANKLVWSDQVFRIFGYEPGEIQVSNENFFKAVHPDDREKIRQAVAETVQTGKP